MRGPTPAIAATSSRSTASPATSRPAVNAPVDGIVDDGGRFLPAAALRERFAAVGVAEQADRPVVTSCGSGVSACQNALGMRVAGLPDPILYAGSYSEWTRADLPIATGDEPGEPLA
jgi:thiosulfate/3-mercaptopyruvate sulfurtransferase